MKSGPNLMSFASKKIFLFNSYHSRKKNLSDNVFWLDFFFTTSLMYSLKWPKNSPKTLLTHNLWFVDFKFKTGTFFAVLLL